MPIPTAQQALIAEINAKSLQSLVDKRDDNAVAKMVNAGRVKVGPHLGGVGDFLRALGPDAGGAALDAMDVMPSPVKWMMVLIRAGTFDFGDPSMREQIDALAALGTITVAGAAALKALAEQADLVSVADVSRALNGEVN